MLFFLAKAAVATAIISSIIDRKITRLLRQVSLWPVNTLPSPEADLSLKSLRIRSTTAGYGALRRG
jgi:hypothetical protein